LGHTCLQSGAGLADAALTDFAVTNGEQLLVLPSTSGISIAMIRESVAGQAGKVHTKAHSAGTEARLEVEHESLSPLAVILIGGISTEIFFLRKIIITQIQAQLAVLDEISGSELAHAQGADGYGYGHGSFFHVSLQLFF